MFSFLYRTIFLLVKKRRQKVSVTFYILLVKRDDRFIEWPTQGLKTNKKELSGIVNDYAKFSIYQRMSF